MWTPLTGGRSNRLWRIAGAPTCTGGALVLKLFAPADDNPLFRNDPDAEAALLCHLAPHGLAPMLLARANTPMGTCLLYEHVQGQPWRSGVASAAHLLGRLHDIPTPAGLPAAPDGSAALAAHTARILDACPTATARDARMLAPCRTAVPPSGRRSLLHGDPVPGNLIGRGARWRLIDWQCPATGDPCEDLALFLSPAMQAIYRGGPLTVAQREAFLAACPDRAAAARYRRLAPWYHWRMLAYCLWRAALGSPDAEAAVRAERAALDEAMQA